jgi:hypothetical protein
MAYIGSTPTTQSFISGTDYFNGTGSQTSFTLSRPVGSVNDIQAVVNNVVQVPNDAYNVSGTSIVFTSAPSAGTGNVYVRYMSTTTQSITPSQNTVSYATWNSNLQNQTFAFKNRLINGDMAIDQRNNGASVTPGVSGIYTLDRWYVFQNTAGRAYTVQRTSTAPAGFTNALLVTTTTGASAGTTNSFAQLLQPIEGFNVADLGWGTANAASVTLSFLVRSSLTGQFGGAIFNNATNRSYPFSYTINAANTYEYKTITIPGDTTGTWLTNNGVGIYVNFNLGAGSAQLGTAGAWSASGLSGSTGDTQVLSTTGATFFLTGVQFEKGTTATNFDVLPYTTELQLCQRYFEKSYNQSQVPGTVDSSAYTSSVVGSNTVADRQVYGQVFFKASKRAVPTIVVYGYSGGVSRVSNASSGADLAVNSGSSNAIGEHGFNLWNNSGGTVSTSLFAIIYQWTASSEL